MNKKLLYILVPGLIILIAASIAIPVIVVNRQQSTPYTAASISILNNALSISCKVEAGIYANLTSGEPIVIPNLDVGFYSENGADWAIFIDCLLNYEDFDYYSVTIVIDKIGSFNNCSAIILVDAYYPNNTSIPDDNLINIGIFDDFAFGYDQEEYHYEFTLEGAYGIWLTILTKEGSF